MRHRKRCTKCGRLRSLNLFNRDSRNSDGRRGHCRDCKREHDAEFKREQRKDPAFRQAEREARTLGSIENNRKTAVYEWRDTHGNIVYIGVTSQRLSIRSSAHVAGTEWAKHCVPPSSALRIFATRREALAFEEGYIKALVCAGVDLFNRTHNERNSPEHYRQLLARVSQ